MQYNEYYGSAYNFEVGYLEGLRYAMLMLAQFADLDDVRTQLGELIRNQLDSVKKELPEE
jgi:hypothetical protein|tara:strand:+ start:699 stop:878 length:180 start_codon:yes stop_codon:yes gene_type:complete